MNSRIVALLKASLECSVFISPLAPGLTFEELREVARRLGFQDGEIDDSITRVGDGYWGESRVLPSQSDRAFWHIYLFETPDYRNFTALDFIYRQLNSLVKSEGVRRAMINRDVAVERAAIAGIPRLDMQAAITYLVLAEQLIEADGVLRFRYTSGELQVPSSQRHIRQPRAMPDRERAYPIVQDIIRRRTDGRPANAEPLDEFAAKLDGLGLGPFQLWWTQIVTEMKSLDPSTSPVSVSVLAAAIVEGALTFIVDHGRKSGRFKSSDFDGDAHTWRADKLVNSAASGSGAIFDASTKARVEALLRARQRIHAGRVISDYKARLPDIRPDEARDAKATAGVAVRAILDWLQATPA